MQKPKCLRAQLQHMPDAGQHLVLPVDDISEIQAFCKLLDLQRGSDPGLSLVVPWPDPDVSEQTLVKAVLRDYFYPILTGELDVFIETPTLKTILDSNSLIAEAKKLGDKVTGGFQSILELAAQYPGSVQLEVPPEGHPIAPRGIRRQIQVPTIS